MPIDRERLSLVDDQYVFEIILDDLDSGASEIYNSLSPWIIDHYSDPSAVHLADPSGGTYIARGVWLDILAGRHRHDWNHTIKFDIKPNKLRVTISDISLRSSVSDISYYLNDPDLIKPIVKIASLDQYIWNIVDDIENHLTEDDDW